MKLKIAFVMLRDLFLFLGMVAWWYVGFVILRFLGAEIPFAIIWPLIIVVVLVVIDIYRSAWIKSAERRVSNVQRHN